MCRWYVSAGDWSVHLHQLPGRVVLRGRFRHRVMRGWQLWCKRLARRTIRMHHVSGEHILYRRRRPHGMRCWLLPAVDWAVHLYHLSNRFLLYQWCRCDQLPSWYLWRRHWPDRIRIVYHLPDHAVLYRRHCGPRMRCWHIWCRCWPHLGERVYHLPGWFVVQCRCGDCVYRWHIPAGDWTVDLHYLHDWFLLRGWYSDRILSGRDLRRHYRPDREQRVQHVHCRLILYRHEWQRTCHTLPSKHIFDSRHGAVVVVRLHCMRRRHCFGRHWCDIPIDMRC